METFMGGRQTPRVELYAGLNGAPGSAPRIVAAEDGISCMSSELKRWEAATPGARATATCIRRLARVLRDHADGLFIAFASAPGAPSPLVLIQDDRPTAGDSNYYTSRHSLPDRVWKDYFHAAGFHTFEGIEQRWKADAVRLSHPGGDHNWAPDMAPAFFEGLGHLIDEQWLSLRKVYVDDGRAIREAAAILEAERRRGEQLAYRPREVVPRTLADFGLECPESARIDIVQVILPGASLRAPDRLRGHG